MNTTKQNIKSWLPIFSGFYNTIWEFDHNYVLEYINEDRQREIDFDNLKIDYRQYENDISREFCDQIKSVLYDYIEKVEFEKLQSPKEYNYINDSIDIIITPNIDNIQKFIYENKEEFCQYLKDRYTGYDGYIPFYENDFETWRDDTKDFSDFSCNGHYLGSILQFIAEILDIQELNIYYDMELNYLEYIENLDQCLNTPVCNKCNKFIDDIGILQDIGKYKDIMKKYPSYILCLECLENN